MRLITFPLAALVAQVAAAAPPLENLDRLDARVAVLLGGTAADAGLRAMPIDRRLRLLLCAEDAALDTNEPGAVNARCASRGWNLRIPLSKAGAAAAEMVIRRGDTVELSVTGAAFSVSTTAIATEDGSTGGLVRIKTSAGSASLTARVNGPGAVAVSVAN